MPDRPSKASKSRSPPQPKQTPAADKDRPGAPAKSDSAFDLWLERGLHRLFDDIAQEPIPDALLKIIEQNRNDP
jgi:hypothetical protein